MFRVLLQLVYLAMLAVFLALPLGLCFLGWVFDKLGNLLGDVLECLIRLLGIKKLCPHAWVEAPDRDILDPGLRVRQRCCICEATVRSRTRCHVCSCWIDTSDGIEPVREFAFATKDGTVTYSAPCCSSCLESGETPDEFIDRMNELALSCEHKELVSWTQLPFDERLSANELPDLSGLIDGEICSACHRICKPVFVCSSCGSKIAPAEGALTEPGGKLEVYDDCFLLRCGRCAPQEL